MAAQAEGRSYDGSGNNLANPSWGAAGTTLVRAVAAAYDDGLSAPRGSSGSGLPNPRLISNLVVAQLTMLPNTHQMSDWVFQWGQFVDHDLDLSNAASPPEPFNIIIPAGEPMFDPLPRERRSSLFCARITIHRPASAALASRSTKLRRISTRR
nr:peroxidase family protein [Candidatus Accumulibacter phosphatis]